VTDDTGPRFNKASLSRYVIALAVAAVVLVGKVVVAHDRGYSWVDILWVLSLIVIGTVLFLLLLFGLFDWRNSIRAQTLSATNPTAFVGQVVTDATLVRQVDEFAVKLTGHRSKVRVNSYVTLVADRSNIRIFSGSRRPREAVAFPTAMLVRASIGSSQSGARIVPCLDLVLQSGGASTILSVHFMRTNHSVPRFVRGERLDAALQAFRTATASTG
jgi:hypothetical protein